MMAAPAFMLPGVMEILMVLLLGGGGIVPTGIPPLPEDPAIMNAAPGGTMLFVEWFGCGEADALSRNATERLAANKEIRGLVSTVKNAFKKVISNEMSGEDLELAKDGFKLFMMLYSSPGCLFVSDFKLPPQQPSFSAGMVINVKGKVLKTKKIILKFEKLLLKEMARGKNQARCVVSKLGDATFREFPMPAGAPPVAWGYSGDYLVLAIGKGMKEKVVNNMNTAGGLSRSKVFQKSFNNVHVKSPALRSYINIAQILEKVGPIGGPKVMKILNILGITRVNCVVSESGLDGEGFASKSFIQTTGKPSGLLKLFSESPLTGKDLSIIPADSTLAVAFKFDAETVYNEFLSMLGSIDPRARREFLEEVISQPEKALGIDIRRDILEVLGDTWCAWNSPSDGGLLITGLTIAVSIKDTDHLQNTMKKIISVAEREMGSPVRTGSRRPRRGVYIDSFFYRGTKIYYLNAIGEELFVAPAWCISGGKLLVSMFPQMLKSTIARKSNPDNSIANYPPLTELGKAVFVSYLDLPEVFRLIYPVLHPLAQAACSELQKEGFDIKIPALPTTGAIIPNLKPEISIVKRTPNGILSISRGVLPSGGGVLAGPMYAGIASAVLIPTLVVGHRSVSYPAPRVSRQRTRSSIPRNIKLRRIQPAPKTRPPQNRALGSRAKIAKQMVDLRSLSVAIQMYELEKGKYPESLDKLWTGKEKFIDRAVLDQTGRPFKYFGTDVKPGGIIVSATAPLYGKRQVLYKDGSVKSIPEAEYLKLAKTLKKNQKKVKAVR